MLHTCSLPVGSGSTSSEAHTLHHPLVLKESSGMGGHDSYEQDYHVRHKPLKRRGLSKF